MSKKIWVSALLPIAISVVSCTGGNRVEQSSNSVDTALDTVPADTLSEMEEEIQTAEQHDRLDYSFDDFLFAFTHSRKLQSQRIAKPLILTTAKGDEEEIQSFDGMQEFAFLEGDYYTVLYGASTQIEEEKEQQDSIVRVERIDLDNQQVRTYEFNKSAGRWKLVGLVDDDLSVTGLQDFLSFYARFSTDSVFQAASIAKTLKMAVLDPDDDESYIEGIIDADQFSSFCSEVPKGVISNIYYGQRYDSNQLILQKCGSGNGMQEFFTFHRDASGWHLTSYEN